MDYATIITLPPTITPNLTLDMWTSAIPTNSEETFTNIKTNIDLIEAIRLTELKLNIISPELQSFDFIKSIEIYINAEGIEEKKIAWHDSVPQTGLSSIIMVTSEEDFKEYIDKDEYKLRCHIITYELVLANTNIEIKNTFFVDAILSEI